MLIGRSYGFGSIKRDVGRRNFHGTLIRQSAPELNKWKCISFPFPFLYLCAPCHLKEFLPNTNSSSNYSQIPNVFIPRVPLSSSLSISLLALKASPPGSHRLSVIKEITLKELQIGHSSDAWSDLTETDSHLSPLHLPPRLFLVLLVAILSTAASKEERKFGITVDRHKKQEQDRNAVFLHKHSIETAQLNGCQSWESLDSKKLCLFVYSIYWYKDSSLRDTIYYDMWSRVALVQNFKQARRQRQHDERERCCLLLGPLCQLASFNTLKRYWADGVCAHTAVYAWRRAVAGQHFTSVFPAHQRGEGFIARLEQTDHLLNLRSIGTNRHTCSQTAEWLWLPLLLHWRVSLVLWFVSRDHKYFLCCVWCFITAKKWNGINTTEWAYSGTEWADLTTAQAQC